MLQLHLYSAILVIEILILEEGLHHKFSVPSQGSTGFIFK